MPKKVIATADLYDERGEDLQSLSLQMENMGGNPNFFGKIQTVRCFRDNALLKQVLSTPGNGNVLVIDGAGSLKSALVGDVIAGLALENGWAGIVVNGAIRDRLEIVKLKIGLKALGSNPAKSTKTGAGEKNVQVIFGDVVFKPGAMLWSDADGILVEK